MIPRIACLVLPLVLAIPAVAGEPTPQAQASAELPAALFGAESTFSTPVFSPDGKRIAYRRASQLAIIDLEKRTNVGITRGNWPFGVEDYDWAGNEHLWVSNSGRYVALINRDGSESGVNPPVDGMVSVIDWADRKAGLLVVEMRRRADRRSAFAIFDLNTRQLDDKVIMPAETEGFGGDPLRGLAFVRCAEGEKYWIARWNPTDRKWKTLQEWKDGDAHWDILYGRPPTGEMYVLSDLAGGPRGVWRYDIDGQKLTECVFQDPVYDVHALVFDPSKEKLVGIAYEAERLRFRSFDPELAAVMAKLEQKIPNTVHRPVQFSDDGSFIIFYSYSDRDPGCYYLYDRRRHRLDEIGVVMRGVDPDKMASTQPIEFAARDGQTIRGYLTLPNGRPGTGLPVVVWVPSYGSRATWGFDADVQFFANRGFAVLQVNPRGSGGYGREFALAGRKQWGKRVQDDVTDGVRWLITSGTADPKRIVIGGRGYGAFVALSGVASTPELYCAAIGIKGIYDLQNLYSATDSVERRLWLQTHIGDRKSPEEWQRLADVSPVRNAERVQVPVLLVYLDDGRGGQGPLMYRALKDAKKDVERFGPIREVKQSQIYLELDKFLGSRGLKARANTAALKSPR